MRGLESSVPCVAMDCEVRSMFKPNGCTPGTSVAVETETSGTAPMPSCANCGVVLPSGNGELRSNWLGPFSCNSRSTLCKTKG
jgi:hypothetical protein